MRSVGCEPSRADETVAIAGSGGTSTSVQKITGPDNTLTATVGVMVRRGAVPLPQTDLADHDRSAYDGP